MNTGTTVQTLNRLIEVSLDGEQGFRACAEQIRDLGTRSLFQARAEECRLAAAELQSLVLQYGAEAEDSGSVTGALHRGWVAVKGTLTGHSDKAILEETERGEDVALEAYREALAEELPQIVRTTLERQLEGVKRNHAQVRSLRDQARAEA